MSPKSCCRPLFAQYLLPPPDFNPFACEIIRDGLFRICCAWCALRIGVLEHSGSWSCASACRILPDDFFWGRQSGHHSWLSLTFYWYGRWGSSWSVDFIWRVDSNAWTSFVEVVFLCFLFALLCESSFHLFVMAEMMRSKWPHAFCFCCKFPSIWHESTDSKNGEYSRTIDDSGLPHDFGVQGG